jgi:ferredoxin
MIEVTIDMFSKEEKCSLEMGDRLTELDNVLMFGCRQGACGSCAIKILSGSENLSEMTFDERDFLESITYDPQEYRLACQCRVYGDIKIQQ